MILERVQKLNHPRKLTAFLQIDGKQFSVDVTAGELQSYKRFQQAVIAAHGMLFRDSHVELSYRPAEAWADSIELALKAGRKAAEVAA